MPRMQLTITLYSEIINIYHIIRWKERSTFIDAEKPSLNSISISDFKNKNKIVFQKCFVTRSYVCICVCVYVNIHINNIYDIYEINVCISVYFYTNK